MPSQADEIPTTHDRKSTTVRSKTPDTILWLRMLVRATSAVAPALAARLVQARFFTPHRLTVRSEQRAMLARGEQHLWVVNGQRIVGWTWGQGPTIALVHGWSAHAGFMTAWVDPLVQAGCRVVAWDMPAHGASGGRRSSVVHYAAVLEHIADSVGPLHGVIAHSLGTVATLYALSRGLATKRAVLVAPPAHLGPLWTRFRTELGVPEHIWHRMITNSERWLATDFRAIEPLLLAPNAAVPMLVLHDADDQEIPYTDGETLARSLPCATLRRTAGLGHRRIMRDTASITEAVRFVTDSQMFTLQGGKPTSFSGGRNAPCFSPL